MLTFMPLSRLKRPTHTLFTGHLRVVVVESSLQLILRCSIHVRLYALEVYDQVKDGPQLRQNLLQQANTSTQWQHRPSDNTMYITKSLELLRVFAWDLIIRMLPQTVCTTLAQVCSKHYWLMNSYKACITAGITSVHSNCGVAPHSVKHLFQCLACVTTDNPRPTG